MAVFILYIYMRYRSNSLYHIKNSICLSVCPSTCLSVSLCVCPSVSNPVCPSVSHPVCVCLSVCPSVSNPVCVRLSVCLSPCPSVRRQALPVCNAPPPVQLQFRASWRRPLAPPLSPRQTPQATPPPSRRTVVATPLWPPRTPGTVWASWLSW